MLLLWFCSVFWTTEGGCSVAARTNVQMGTRLIAGDTKLLAVMHWDTENVLWLAPQEENAKKKNKQKWCILVYPDNNLTWNTQSNY